MYQKDYFFYSDGTTLYDDPPSHSRSNALWIEFSDKYLTLGPEERVTVVFEVTIPDSVPETGTYWSMVMIQGVQPVDTSMSSQGISIRSLIRYGIQIVTHVGTEGEYDLSFSNFTLERDSSSVKLVANLENTGDYLLRPELSIELFNADGESIGVFEADIQKIYPGTSTRNLISLEGIRPGEYNSLLIADCGKDNIFGMNVTIEIRDD